VTIAGVQTGKTMLRIVDAKDGALFDLRPVESAEVAKVEVIPHLERGGTAMDRPVAFTHGQRAWRFEDDHDLRQVLTERTRPVPVADGQAAVDTADFVTQRLTLASLRQPDTTLPACSSHQTDMKIPAQRFFKAFLVAFAWGVGVLAVMQLVPYGRAHSNPPVLHEPQWASPHVRELAVRACFNCHSNQTTWPWYANVAPLSWVTEFDVESARSVVNFSEWNRTYDLAPYSGQSLRTGNMPPFKYSMAHPEANLTQQETLELARGLDAMLRPPEWH